MSEDVAVVIPYFQRSPGILSRALSSLAGQDFTGRVSVLIVDDGSPAPADPEVGRVSFGENYRIKLIRQPNKGPGAARNAALDELPSAFRYVAFLDSDDEWLPTHLSSAVKALSCGFDVFFSDLLQWGSSVPLFQRSNFVASSHGRNLPPNAHHFAFEADIFDQTIRLPVIGTSSVVYDFYKFPELRFRPEYRRAGEDMLFWLDLAAAGARFVLSNEVEAVYGRGVNVYAGVTWGSAESIERLSNELLYRRVTLKEYPLQGEQRTYLRRCIAELRKDVSLVLLRRILNLSGLPLASVHRLIRSDPGLLPRVPFLLLLAIFELFAHHARRLKDVER